MARQKGRTRISYRRERSKGRRKFRLFKPQWIDPYPWIAGTKPEKMIFAALRERNIYFIFQDTLPEWKEGNFATLAAPDFIPDFIIPAYRVIIDPFGDYHHMLAEAVSRDAYKMAVYEAMGYNFVHPWASTVEANGAHDILFSITEMNGPPLFPIPKVELPYVAQGYRLGPYVGLGASSVAAANRRRAGRTTGGFRIRR